MYTYAWNSHGQHVHDGYSTQRSVGMSSLYCTQKNAYVTWRTLCSRDEDADLGLSQITMMLYVIFNSQNFQRSTIGHLCNSCTSCYTILYNRPTIQYNTTTRISGAK